MLPSRLTRTALACVVGDITGVAASTAAPLAALALSWRFRRAIGLRRTGGDAQLAVAPEPAQRRLTDTIQVGCAGPVNLIVGRLEEFVRMRVTCVIILASMALVTGGCPADGLGEDQVHNNAEPRTEAHPLDAVPEPDDHAIRSITDAHDWRNPFVIVHRD